jgi:hypothetical protein
VNGRRRVLALSAACTVALLGGSGAGATDPVPAGSWTQLRQQAPVGDTPDLRADQGADLAVEGGVGGVVTFSAVQAPSGAEAVRGLTLTFREPPTGTPVIWACPARGPWQPGSRQAWQDRPDYDCASHSAGTVDEDSVTWDLSGLGVAARSIALVPGGEQPAAFTALFHPPAATAFTLGAAGRDGGPAPAPEAPPAADRPAAAAEAPAVEPAVERAGEGVLPPGAVPGLAPVAPVVAGEDPPPVGAATEAALERVTAAEPLPPTQGVSRGGPLLLAFLALLAMVRTALPVGPAGTPRSLLAHPQAPEPARPAP